MRSFDNPKKQSEYYWSDTQIDNEILILESQLAGIKNQKNESLTQSKKNWDNPPSDVIQFMASSWGRFEGILHRGKFLNLILEARKMVEKTAYEPAKVMIESLDHARIDAKDYTDLELGLASGKEIYIFTELYKNLMQSQSKDDIIKSLTTALMGVEVPSSLNKSYYSLPYFVSNGLRDKMEDLLNQIKKETFVKTNSI